MVSLSERMRTFIFGAEASAHAGYPLANTLWPALENWARTSTQIPPEFLTTIEKTKSRFDVSRPFELILGDLENQLAHIPEEEKGNSKSGDEKMDLSRIQWNLREMIHHLFNSLRHLRAELYANFASNVLSRGDSVITFNYDLALDRAMKDCRKWSIGDGYSFETDAALFGASPCKLLKLYGSTNWHAEVFKGAMRGGGINLDDLSLGGRPVIDRSEFEFLGYANGSDPECHTSRNRFPALIMGREKKFLISTSFGDEWEPFWDSLWMQAHEALESSNEVHLIGYSAPEFDARARDLLAAVARTDARVYVCCHCDTERVLATLRELGVARALPAAGTTFEEWLAHQRGQ